jgi:hypothetical protein
MIKTHHGSASMSRKPKLSERQRIGTHKMQGISLNRPVIGEAKSTDCGARATAHKGIRGLRAVKGRTLERLGRYGILVVTVWLLLAPTSGFSQASSSPINLLSPKNGGQVVVATNNNWLRTIDGNEERAVEFASNDWVVYAFKNEQQAAFDTFTVLIPRKGDNLKEFELLAGNDSPTGVFDSIGKFKPVNALVIKSPYQEFKFPPITAKYLKLQIVSGWGDFFNSPIAVYQFKLFGRLKE